MSKSTYLLAHCHISQYLNLQQHCCENLKFCNGGTDESQTGMGKMTGDSKCVSGSWKRQRFNKLSPGGASMELQLQEAAYKDHRQRKAKHRLVHGKSLLFCIEGMSERLVEAVCFFKLRCQSSRMWCWGKKMKSACMSEMFSATSQRTVKFRIWTAICSTAGSRCGTMSVCTVFHKQIVECLWAVWWDSWSRCLLIFLFFSLLSCCFHR